MQKKKWMKTYHFSFISKKKKVDHKNYEESQKKSVYRQIDTIISQFNTLFI